uniref:Uncharacterized protein n=1 Tax=Arabidopsis thaliana TaxID=3702 RepID=Q0WN15_ARATH|nr:hypothetical protein [Arabidopsis thaliana]
MILIIFVKQKTDITDFSYLDISSFLCYFNSFLPIELMNESCKFRALGI